MAKNIERLNYYEREYLRSFDFEAEQRYHIETRRRLNMALHLWGIVDGLELTHQEIYPGGPKKVAISPGMAIDAYGREIVLFQPQSIQEEDLSRLGLTIRTTYSVWITYKPELGTPPNGSYRICDVRDQYTRWRESAEILIRPEPDPAAPDVSVPPSVFEEMSDKPADKPWPVKLGLIKYGELANLKSVINVTDPAERVYVGLRSQRIASPSLTVPAPPADEVLDTIEPFNAPLSLNVEPNLFANRNVIVGKNFQVPKAKIKPAPTPVAPAVFPNPAGNLKVSSDLFLQGNLYSQVGPDWLNLGEYIKTLVPEFIMGTKTITPVPNNDPSTGQEDIKITTSLPIVREAKLFVSLIQIQWQPWSTMANWFGQIDTNKDITIDLSVGSTPGVSANGKDYTFTTTWTVGPLAPAAGANPDLLNVKSFRVNYLAIFYP